MAPNETEKPMPNKLLTKQQQHIGLQTQSTSGWILKLMSVAFDSGSGHWYGGRKQEEEQ